MTDCGYTAPIPGPDPGACPDCGSWRKAGMIHECVDATDRAVWREIAKRAEMRWMSVEDAEITVPARSVALASRELAAAAEQTQRTDQAFEEIARLREFGEHYSGAAQDAWDRIEVLEKALRFWVNRADLFGAQLPPGRQYMRARGVLTPSYAIGRALAAGSAADRNEAEPADFSSEVCGDRAESQFGGGRRCCHLRAGHDGPHRDRHLRWSNAETWSNGERGQP